jgi:hypothetical protein
MEEDHSEDVGADRRIILKCMLRRSVGRAWTGLICLRVGISVGLV